MDGAEHQLDRPLGGDALGLQGVGEAEAAHHQIGPRGAHPLQLALHVLAFTDAGALRQQGQLGIEELAIEVGGAHLHQLHAALALQETPQGELQLGIGQQEQAFARQQLPVGSDGAAAPFHQGIQHSGHLGRRHPKGRRPRRHPGPAALHAEGIGGRQQTRPAVHQSPRRGREERLGQQHAGARADRGQVGGTAWRQARDHRNPQAAEQLHQPVFDRIGQGAHDQQLLHSAAGHQRHHRQQGLVFPLGEGGFDATAAVVEHLHPAGQLGVEALGGLGQIELDHLAGATAHQKQGADLRAPHQQIAHQPVELLIGISQAGQVALPEDRGAEAGLGKDHHAGGALDQVGTGAGAHHQEKGIGHAPVQPHDGGEAAEHLPLAALPQQLGLNHGRRCRGGSPTGLARAGQRAAGRAGCLRDQGPAPLAGPGAQSGGRALRASLEPITTRSSPSCSTWEAGGFTCNWPAGPAASTLTL